MTPSAALDEKLGKSNSSPKPRRPLTRRGSSVEDASPMGASNPLDEKSRNELVEEARQMGVERPERMTRVELRDEIVRRSVPEERQAEARGLFGVARSMLASVVDKGLNLPDAAKAIRGKSSFEVPVTSQTPVATVTLAEIYAAQGHKSRALRILEDVLREEPGHEEALRVQAELRSGTGAGLSQEQSAREFRREALTLEAPPVEEVSQVPPPVPGETTEYVPGGFLETTGEEIETGRPPEAAEIPPEAVDVSPEAADIPSEAVDVPPEAADVPPEAADVPPEAVEIPPAAAEIPSEAVELPPEAAVAKTVDQPASQTSETPPLEEPPSFRDEEEDVPLSSLSETTLAAEHEPEFVAPSAGIENRSVALVVAQSEAGLAFYFELPEATLDECSVDRSDGRAVARIVSFSPHGASPERREDTVDLAETISADAPWGVRAGSLRLSRHGAPAFVRAALGWESEDGFLPFTVARNLSEVALQEGAADLHARASLALS